MTSEIEEPKSTGGVVARGVAISGATNIFLRFLDIAIAVLLLRWLSIFEFGVYRLALAAYDFATGFFLSGIENVVVSDVSGALLKEPRAAKNLFTVYVVFLGFVAVGIAAVFFWGGNFLASRFPGIEAYTSIVAFLFLLSPLETAYKLKFQIFLDFGWSSAFRVLRDVSRLLSLGGLFFFFSFGVQQALWSLVFAVGFPILVVLIGYRRESLLAIPAPSEARQAIRNLFLRHGKWAVLDDFAANTGKNIRPFIIRLFAGTEAVAIFSVAQNLMVYTISVFPMREVLTPVLPRMADDPARLAGQIARAAKYTAAAYVLLGLAGAVAAPVIVNLLFPQYVPSLPLYYILILGLPWLGYRSVMLPVFYALKHQDALFFLTAFRLAVVTVLGVILVYLFGVWGAALEVLILNIILTPAFSKALARILPSWHQPISNLFTIDGADRVAYAEVKRHIGIKIRRLWS